ncbi:MAG: hypothetical protein HC915_17045 [Anaerolineae bacterium]|nr:hypothetical protein [Anaerolineae bacterium]
MSQTNSGTFNFTLVQIGAIVVAIVGIILGTLGAASDLDRFYQVYLFAFLFWLTLAQGCLIWLLLGSVFDSRWVYNLKRLAAAGARTMPLLGLLAIPLLVSQPEVFPWAKEGVELGAEKEVYLNQAFFALRSLIYFLVWTVLAYVLSEWDYAADRGENTRARVQPVAILGIVLYFITATFAAFDWMLSLDYNSFSSIFGWLAMSQQALAGLGFLLMVLALFWTTAPMVNIATPKAIGDLGALLLVSLMTWGYLNFMQFIVIWSGNIPEKANLYAIRFNAAWEGYSIVMVALHFIAFVLLILPGVKRMRPALAVLGGGLLLLRVVEMYWIVMPPFYDNLRIEVWDFALILGFGGFWVALFLWSLARQPLLPENDPSLEGHLARPDHEVYAPDGTVRPAYE